MWSRKHPPEVSGRWNAGDEQADPRRWDVKSLGNLLPQ
jgi:hypothetical protein